jgi:hypothetical protein
MALGFIRGRKPDAGRIQARVVEAKKRIPEAVEGVQPLASGFFLLERMRASRSAGRPKLKGER